MERHQNEIAQRKLYNPDKVNRGNNSDMVPWPSSCCNLSNVCRIQAKFYQTSTETPWREYPL